MRLFTFFEVPALVAGCLVVFAGAQVQPTEQSGSAAVDASTGAPPTTDVSGQTFEARLAGVDAKMAAVVDLRADFEQKKTTALLKKPLISGGSLVCRGDSVLWHTTRPRKCDMLVADGKVTVYYPEDKLAEEYSVGPRLRDATGGPLPRLSRLRETFDFSEIDGKEAVGSADGRAGKLGLRLTPKSDELKQHVASIRVLIDESVPCADRMVIIDPDGDETELRFTAARINTGVRDSELLLNLPEGTRVSTPTKER